MRMMSGLIAASSVFLLFAGCTEPADVAAPGADTVTPASAPASPPPASPPPASPTAPRPSPTPSSPPASPAPSPATPSGPSEDEPAENATDEATSAPFHFEGSFDTTACVPSDVDACAYVVGGSGTAAEMADAAGKAIAYNFNLTWEASSPGTEELQIWVDRVESCGDGCWQFEDAHVVIGTSPLAIEGDATELGDGPLRVWVRRVNMAAYPAFGYAHLSQDFVVDGTVTYP